MGRILRQLGLLRGLTGRALEHRSLPHKFKSWHCHIWKVFHLWLRFLTFGSHLDHLAYLVHKSDHKTSINQFLGQVHPPPLDIHLGYDLCTEVKQNNHLWNTYMEFIFLYGNYFCFLLEDYFNQNTNSCSNDATD